MPDQTTTRAEGGGPARERAGARRRTSATRTGRRSGRDGRARTTRTGPATGRCGAAGRCWSRSCSAEALAVAVLAVSFARSPVPGGRNDWINFGILAAGATVHIQLTQRQEERRRNRTKKGPDRPHRRLDVFRGVDPAGAARPCSSFPCIRRSTGSSPAGRPTTSFSRRSRTASPATLAHLTYTALGPHLLGPAGWSRLPRASSARSCSPGPSTKPSRSSTSAAHWRSDPSSEPHACVTSSAAPPTTCSKRSPSASAR